MRGVDTSFAGKKQGGHPRKSRSTQLYVQWVVKVSKRCNLRCKYCYEFPFLADPARMQLPQLERMFQHIAEYYEGSTERMDFVWHGGEPLLLPATFYRSIGEIQRRVLGDVGIAFSNSVQTNLVHLDKRTLKLFGNFFTNVGVSIDLFGGLRVNVSGNTVEKKVIQNMQLLKDRGIVFGCITVLSKSTAPHVMEIYKFFEDINVGFRLLPIYRTGYEGQQDNLALTSTEIVDAFTKVVNYWMSTDSCLTVLPIQDYVDAVVARLSGTGGAWRCYDKVDREIVYIIDTDGSVYSNADAYEPRLCHGNIFEESLQSMQESENYLRAVNAAHSRMKATCSRCRFHGACSGYFMAEATPEQRWCNDQGTLTCGVAQPIQAYIEQLLICAGLVDPRRGLLVRERLIAKLKESEMPLPAIAGAG